MFLAYVMNRHGKLEYVVTRLADALADYGKALRCIKMLHSFAL
jgi:hypothetical protein